MSDLSEDYKRPTLEKWGTVEEITATGSPDPAEDAKGGSVTKGKRKGQE